MDIIRRNKSLIGAVLIAMIGIIIIIINIYVDYDLHKYYSIVSTDISSYSAWITIFNNRYGQWNLIISPIIIMIGTTHMFSQEIQSGYFKDLIMRKNYKNYILNSILKCYKKSIFIYPVLFIGFFFIFSLLFTNKISSDNSTLFSYVHLIHLSPIQFIFVEILSVILFSIFVINITLIVMRYIKKFNLCVIMSFIILNFYNYILGAIGYSIFGDVIFNVYDGFTVTHEIKLPETFVGLTIGILITSTVLYYVYKDKEKIMLYEG